MSGGVRNKSPIAVYVVPATALPILRLNACQKLGLIKRIGEVDRNENQIVKDSVLKRLLYCFWYPKTSRRSCLSKSVKRRYCSIFSFRSSTRKASVAAKIENKIDKMQKMEIIPEVVKQTDWAAVMVLALKKNGQIRVCINFSELSKSIRCEQFQIPVAEEIFSKMQLSMLNQAFVRFL